jgi:hypothetical protein
VRCATPARQRARPGRVKSLFGGYHRTIPTAQSSPELILSGLSSLRLMRSRSGRAYGTKRSQPKPKGYGSNNHPQHAPQPAVLALDHGEIITRTLQRIKANWSCKSPEGFTWRLLLIASNVFLWVGVFPEGEESLSAASHRTASSFGIRSI